MKVRVSRNYEDMSSAIAETIAGWLAEGSIRNVVPATGNTPVGAYEKLAERYRRGEFETDQLHVFQLDEYLGVKPTDRQSLYRWMKDSFLDPLEIPEERVTQFQLQDKSSEEACAEYDRALAAAGGFDLSILGLGTNGHLGYNEPPSTDESPTRVVELTAESRAGSASYWRGLNWEPSFGITAGLKLLLGARRIVLLASGASKAAVLRQTLEGPVDSSVPSSFLQRHPDVIVFADAPAASRLSAALIDLAAG